MRSPKSRSRSKSSRNRPSGGNIVNRVFDSSGPEGKVRGTPQQIIDKYNQLTRDAHLSGDRVASENFQQHAEHYLRMLNEAQRDQEAKREEQERFNRERQAERDRERTQRQERESSAPPPPRSDDPAQPPQPDGIDPDHGDTGDSGLVETPENAPRKPAPRRRRKPTEPAGNAPAGNAVSNDKREDGPKDGNAPEAAE
jgi:sRNA-binding protein